MAAGLVEQVRDQVSRLLAQLSPPSNPLLLAAVSGGQDSVCLLDSLTAVLPASAPRPVAVHVNHGLRGVAAEKDAASVAAIAARLDCECVTIRLDVRGYAKRHRLGIEEAGRDLRYQVLLRLAIERGAWAAATGHTLNDLSETLLINTIRGSGPTGMISIPPTQLHSSQSLGPAFRPALGNTPPRATLQVIRPLLGLTREQTGQYCEIRALEVRRDLSNLDPAFLRNRVRHHLMPLLQTYNPSIVPALGRLAHLAAEDEAELERLADAAWQSCARRDARSVEFEWRAWLSHSPAIQRRLLRRTRVELGATDAWSFQSLEAARLLLAGQPARRRLSLGGVDLVTTRRGFHLEPTGKSAKNRRSDRPQE